MAKLKPQKKLMADITMTLKVFLKLLIVKNIDK
jgi:hypothetical protein